jgi:hypothetical protein
LFRIAICYYRMEQPRRAEAVLQEASKLAQVSTGCPPKVFFDIHRESLRDYSILR